MVSPRPAPDDDPAQRAFAGGTAMGDLIRRHDWHRSPLGPVSDWSPALFHAVSLILSADAQIVLFWGPEHVAIYNDAYIPAIGRNHPHALGRPAVEHWRELWDDLAPLLRGVLETGETFAAKDRPFYVERKGFGEEAFFDISYSAIRESDGSVGGVLCIVAETSDRVRAQRQIVEERTRLDQLFAAAPSFMAVLRGPEHVHEVANPAYQQLIGNRDVLGKPAREALPDLIGQGYFEKLDDILRTGKPIYGTGSKISFQADPGTPPGEHYIDFVFQPMTDAAGTVTGVFIEGHDVTAEIESRRELGWSEESLRLANDAAEIGKWDLDLTADTLDWSDRTKAMFGISPGVDCSMADFYAGVHPEDVAATTAAFEAAIDPERRQPYDVEYRTVGKEDGVIRWVAARGRGVFDGNGRCVRAIGTAIDITRRRAQEEALRESEARFRSLADSAPAVIWMTDPAGAVTFMNRWATEKFGVPLPDLLAEGWARLVHPEDLAAFRARLPTALKTRDPFSGDVRTIDRDGHIRWMQCESRPRVIDREFTGYIGVAVDATEARDAAAALERAVAERTGELAAANDALTAQVSQREKAEATLTQMQRLEAVGQLTSGVAHDFNNLLTVVLGNLDMIERRGAEALDDRSRQRLGHMRSAAERGATLTAQLLAFSRRTRLEAAAVDLNETVAAMEGLLQSTLGGAVRIETALAPDLWPASVDSTQIELAILNLAINARDAMEVGGRLTITTGNATLGADERPGAPEPGEYASVSVRDEGVGMTPEVLARVFEPFFTTKPVGKGSGLGLAQVFGFARQSGGGIVVDTVAGSGTTVSIYLPRAGTQRTAPPPRGEMPAGPARAPGRCALAVDDDAAVREVTVELLAALGYDVAEAEGGDAALDYLAAGRAVDLVVADFAMPGMNGAELARRIEELYPALPVLIVTGFADLSAIAHLGEARIVQKPFRAGELERKIAALTDAAP